MQYIFGDYRLDVQCYELRGPGGVMPLDRQGFAVLAYLIEHRDRVVLRQELFEHLWAARFVSDAALEQCIAGIRRAVGDSGRHQRVIQTVHGRGYRFIALLTGTSSVAGAPAVPAPGPSLPMSEPAAAPHARADATGPAPMERRPLTVLWGALVVPPAGPHDPEDLQAWVHTYHQVCTEVILALEGSIAHSLSGDVVAYFGYPQAHDDDARRSIRAGLRLRDALKARSGDGAPGPLTVRVGIDTGLVVVGERAGDLRERLAIGETPQRAAHLKERAAPGSVVISAATARLVDGYFTWQALTPPPGAAPDPAALAYEVLGEQAAQLRFDVGRQHGLTPLVGRDAERIILRERWAQAKDGLGQVLVLRGEAGIGKSRLVHVLHEQVAAEPHRWLEWRCTPETHQSPLYPVLAHLHRVLRWRPAADPGEKLHRLEETLTAAGLVVSEVVPLFAPLLGLPLPGRYPPLTLTPQRQRQQTLEAVLAWLVTETTRQPVLFIVEDVHWSDPSTLDFLTLLLDQGPTARLLTVLTCRPEFVVPWGFRAHLAPLTLPRLPPSQVTQMVERVAGDRVLPPEVVAQIVAKTDGVPLFVEELTKMVLEAGLLEDGAAHAPLRRPLPALAIPDTLHASLLARLDRLGPVKTLAQLGATIGRTFTYAVLQQLTSLEEGPLQDGLRQLVDAELVYQRGLPPQATYTFKHALIQDAAYHSLVRSTRQAYHRRIAEVLAVHFPETATAQPELLGHHYTEAGLGAQAVPYWQQAGQNARARSAYVEAIAHLTQGLEVLQTLPDTPELRRQELEMQITLGPALVASRGYAAAEVAHAYLRAREICQHLEETTQMLPVLGGLFQFYFARADYQTTRVLADQFLHVAQQAQDPVLLVGAHDVLGQIFCLLGEFAPARTHLEHAIALYDPQYYHALALLLGGEDPGVVCRCFASFTLWFLGYPDQSLRRLHEASTLAQEQASPFSRVWALGSMALCYQLRHELPAVQEWADITLSFASEQAFPFWLEVGTLLRSWVRAVQGQEEDGIAQMRHGLDAFSATGAEFLQPYWHALLAEACGKNRQPAEGLTVLDEAFTIAEKHAERFWEAELHRLKGVLLLAHPGSPPPAAERCFLQALDVARRQEAKSLELRAAMSLSRLWQQQGKQAEARALLAPIYGWFTEGFDTADLQEAKALLEVLEG